MKKRFTKLFSTGLLIGLTFIGFAATAQTTSLTNTDATTVSANNGTTTATDGKTEAKPEKAKVEPTTQTKAADPDTAWKPQRRVWGYSFGDFYYDGHSPAVTVAQGKENNYYQVPTYRNAFQFRRIYLGYDYEITKKFKAEFLLASEPNANTGTTTSTVGGVNGTTSINNGDNLADNKMSLYIKNINIRLRDLWTGTDFVIGELSTPGFALNEPGTNAPVSLSESTWGYRSIERTVTDFHKNNSYDVGAALQGTFDPATKNFGYVLMVGNNSTANLLSAASANTGFYKIFYGDLWGKFANNHLYVDLYADYARTAPANGSVTPGIPGQEHNMFKAFVSYNSKPLSVGVEAYTQTIGAGVISNDGTTKTVSDATVQAISLWAKGSFTSTLNWFARYDGYNPDTKFVNLDSYAVNTNYGSYDPYTKEKFITAGLDWNPTKNVHFMPNVWFIQYVNNDSPSIPSTVTAYVPNNHTIVYRMTFFFTFGK